MAITIVAPRPGELIASSSFKSLIDQLVALDVRVTALESVVPGAGGKVVITMIQPVDAVIGDTLAISGVNFGLPSENNVSFDGGSSAVPTVGNDHMLSVSVPPISLGGALSKSVMVSVSNPRGFDQRPITVRAVVPTIPSGSIVVKPGTVPGNIVAGHDWVFPFGIEARTTLDDTYNLVITLPQVAAGQTPWSAKMVTDAGGTQDLPLPLLIPKPTSDQVSTIVQVFVKVSIPAVTTVGNPFLQLDVNSVHNPPPGPNALHGSGSVPFGFNQAQQPPQTVGFAISSFTGPNVSGDTSMVTVTLPAQSTPPLKGMSYLFQGLKAGNYTATLSWSDQTNGNQGWTASFGGAPGAGAWPVTTLPITMTAPGDFGPQKVSLVSAGSGVALNTLVITVKSNSDPTNDYGILNQGIKPA